MTEQWKPIKGFEGQYEVSDLGRVKSVERVCKSRWENSTRPVHERILRAGLDAYGYLRVTLQVDGGKRNIVKKVHRLVAEAFLPNPFNLPDVNHKGDKTDNRSHKLEWISKKDHGRDTAKRGQKGDGVHFKKLRQKYEAYWCPEPCAPEYIGSFDTYEEAKAARDAKVATL
jgi:hypothetical protein